MQASAHDWPHRLLSVMLASLLLAPTAWGQDQRVMKVSEIGPATANQTAPRAGLPQTMPTFKNFNRAAPGDLVEGNRVDGASIDATIWLHLPDPVKAPQVLDKRLEITRFGQDLIEREYIEIYKATKRLIQEIQRPKQIRLTLDDALRRALENNYQIRADGFGPAISAAQAVQAAAVFDVAFFANITRNNTDQPTPSALFATETDTTQISGGVRKVLATGAQVTLSQNFTRVDNPGFQFQVLNPAYTTNFVAELRQPVLRNFGIDFNRSQINISKNQQIIDRETFRATITQVLSDVENAYWNLVLARRNVVISAEILSQARLTYEQVSARSDFDAYRTLTKQSEANLRQQEFIYIDVKNNVYNAEDQLLNLLNDPELPLSSDFEILPVDEPIIQEIDYDRRAMVESALERRPEVIQARHGVDIARINVGIAKNQALPTLDLIYRTTVTGLGGTFDEGFDQQTTNNFIDQFVGLEFAWNIGERAERAGIRIAAFQQSQAVLNYKLALDNVITDCRVACRNLDRNFEQLVPSHLGLTAAAENLRSLQERQERKSPAELDAVFAAQNRLADSRRALLSSSIEYNTGIVNVERAKGTLLEYNNVSIGQRQ